MENVIKGPIANIVTLTNVLPIAAMVEMVVEEVSLHANYYIQFFAGDLLDTTSVLTRIAL